jgi:cephalosporin hydroxylase
MRRILERLVSAMREGGLRLVISKAHRRALARVSMLPASRTLKRRLGYAKTLDEWVNVIYDFEYANLSVAPSQIRSEIAALLRLLQKAPPRVILEIGTGRGGTLLLFARVAAENATLITIDLPLGQPREQLLRAGARSGQEIHILRANSHECSTLERVKRIAAGRAIDFLFIDGDHSYEGVLRDFSLYSPLVHKRGWIAFHDIAPGPMEFVGGVPRLWSELRHGHEVHEFVNDWSQGGLGIGVIRRYPAGSA